MARGLGALALAGLLMLGGCGQPAPADNDDVNQPAADADAAGFGPTNAPADATADEDVNAMIAQAANESVMIDAMTAGDNAQAAHPATEGP